MRRVRKRVGREIPVVVTLDYHANVRPSLLAEIGGLVGYRTYPHVDMAEAGAKAARLLFDILSGRVRPRMHWLPIPLLAPPQRATTDLPPIQEVMGALDHELASDGILSSSFFCVQPWLDIPEVASSLVVVARSANDAIPTKMRSVARQLWDRRKELHMD